METTYDYILHYRNVICHKGSHCTCKFLNVQSQSWCSLEFVEITTSQFNTELQPTNQKTAKITHLTYGTVFIAKLLLLNDETKLQVESRTSKKITFHTYWEDEKLAYFASPTTRTHGYSWRITDFYLWPVRRHLLCWHISAIRIDQSEPKQQPPLCQISDPASFIDIPRFSL